MYSRRNPPPDRGGTVRSPQLVTQPPTTGRDSSRSCSPASVTSSHDLPPLPRKHGHKKWARGPFFSRPFCAAGHGPSGIHASLEILGISGPLKRKRPCERGPFKPSFWRLSAWTRPSDQGAHYICKQPVKEFSGRRAVGTPPTFPRRALLRSRPHSRTILPREITTCRDNAMPNQYARALRCVCLRAGCFGMQGNGGKRNQAPTAKQSGDRHGGRHCANRDDYCVRSRWRCADCCGRNRADARRRRR